MTIGDAEMIGTLPELAMVSGYPLAVLEEHLSRRTVLSGIRLHKLQVGANSANIPPILWEHWKVVTNNIRKRVKWVKCGGRKIVLPPR